jgi:hypothetical protein
MNPSDALFRDATIEWLARLRFAITQVGFILSLRRTGLFPVPAGPQSTTTEQKKNEQDWKNTRHEGSDLKAKKGAGLFVGHIVHQQTPESKKPLG